MKQHGYNYNYNGTNEDHWHGMRQTPCLCGKDTYTHYKINNHYYILHLIIELSKQ